jgi:hypothetical protein
LSLLLAVLINPWLLARLIPASRPDLVRTTALAGFLALLLNSAVPVALHCLEIPIHGASLSAAHAMLFALLAPAAWARSRMGSKRSGIEDARQGVPRTLLFLATLYALLVFPFTALAGIDTYKWLDLADAVQTETFIPWLIHPLSLAGFTPRSYPSIQPLALASFQLMGGLGVTGGYYLISLLSGLTGLFASAALGKRLFPAPTGASWFAALYALSPVFMRYNHWATGRGVFLAILPLFLLACLELPRPKAWLLLAATALALPLCHKAGLVAVPLILASLPLAFVLPRPGHAWIRIPLLAISLGLALMLAGALPASLLTFLHRALTRFGWYLPVAAVAALVLREEWTPPAWRRLFPAACLTFPLAFHREMYGALPALPFVVWFATAGLTLALDRLTAQRRWIAGSAVVLSLLAAITIVVHRSWNATPLAVRNAALFLDGYDPLGPFQVDAPDSVRGRIQGYCSGCPRFEVMPVSQAAVRIRPPPPLRGSPRGVAQAWIDYLRHALSAGDAGIAWYGRNPRLYMVQTEAETASRKGLRVLYEEEGVAVLAPVNQPDPPPMPPERSPWRRN